MEEISRIFLLGIAILAAVLLFTEYEAVLEGILATALVAAVLLGFALHPRKDVFYVRTTVGVSDPDHHGMLEHDYVAVKVDLVRLWLLFVPTVLAVGFLVVSSAKGVLWKFSVLNTIFSTEYAFLALYISEMLPVIVIALVAAWIRERWVMRDAEACSARSYSLARRAVGSGSVGHFGAVSYLFMGEHGEYYGGYSYYLGPIHRTELGTLVFYNPRKPEVNKIAMSFLFHRFIVLGRGVTDLDKETTAAQTALAETTT